MAETNNARGRGRNIGLGKGCGSESGDEVRANRRDLRDIEIEELRRLLQ